YSTVTPPRIRCLFFLLLMLARPPRPTPFPYTTLFRSQGLFWWASRPGAVEPAATSEGVDPAREREVLRREPAVGVGPHGNRDLVDRKSTRLNSSHVAISYAVFCLKKKKLLLVDDVRRW